MVDFILKCSNQGIGISVEQRTVYRPKITFNEKYADNRTDRRSAKHSKVNRHDRRSTAAMMENNMTTV